MAHVYVNTGDHCQNEACGAPEIDPETGLLNFRASKVHTGGQWWSHCFSCHSWVGDSDGAVKPCDDDCYCYDVRPKNMPRLIVAD